jgi:HlyD family secretion protein
MVSSMKNKTIYISLAVLVIGLIAASIILKKSNGNEGTKVAVEAAAKRNIVESVNASGKIFPVVEVKVSPDISGEVIELFVKEGQQVTKGQLLARIDASLYTTNVVRANAGVNQSRAGVANAQAQLEQLNVQLAQAKTNFNRNKKLFEEKVISAAEFEQFSTAYQSAKANIEAAKTTISSTQYNVESSVANLKEANQNIRRANIYAPISGIVSKLNIKQGERVVGTAQMAGTEMMRIADMSRMKIEVEIGENDIQKINIGDSVKIDVDAYPKRKFIGFVTQTAQSNTSSGTSQLTAASDQVSNYTVSIELLQDSYIDLCADKTKFPFRPGMSASAEILTKHLTDVLCVPINAVTTRDADSTKASDENAELKEYVFVVDAANKAKMKEVTTSMQDGEYIVITKGIAEGEKVIHAPYSQVSNKLKDGKAVTIVKKEDLFEAEKDNND